MHVEPSEFLTFKSELTHMQFLVWHLLLTDMLTQCIRYHSLSSISGHILIHKCTTYSVTDVNRYKEKMKIALKEQESLLALERAAALKQQQEDMQNTVNTAIADKDELLILYSKVHTYVSVCAHLCVIFCVWCMSLVFLLC